MSKRKDDGIVEIFNFLWSILEFIVQFFVVLFGIVWIIKNRKGGKR